MKTLEDFEDALHRALEGVARNGLTRQKIAKVWDEWSILDEQDRKRICDEMLSEPPKRDEP